MGFQASTYPEPSFPFDHWNEQQLSWATGVYPMQPTFDSLLFEPGCRLDHQPLASHTTVMDPSFNLQDDSHTSATSSLPSQPPIPLNTSPPSLVDNHWDASWDAVISVTENDKQGASCTVDWSPTNNYDVRKRLFKLNLEMIDDLELLETGSDILQPSAFPGSDTGSSAGKLEIPVFRMLNHSTQFLEILQSGIGASEDPLHLIPSIEFPNGETNTFEYLKPFSEGVEKINESSALSHHSDHPTSNPALSDQMRDSLPPACDVSTSMGMLTAYCHLIRVYRATFNQLYQLFLLVPPADAAAFLLLPSSQHGQFHMEGNLTVQVQVLIDLSTNMLAKIERALGISCSETDECMGPVASVLASGPLTSVRDHIITQEQVECGIPLKETMSCLRKLVSDPICV
ncbi:hypothetical protein N7494_012716 [Penicillium frequentans]|uniref:Aflatoxin regulatory protein domain-containing protein n=1 Tax=Penicillium frequentans TaxID=3151616 RepID=A0AAD6CMM2_9EURO|nr:hypothetical protein N7494_012716 [Penicillium glabrum]